MCASPKGTAVRTERYANCVCVYVDVLYVNRGCVSRLGTIGGQSCGVRPGGVLCYQPWWLGPRGVCVLSALVAGPMAAVFVLSALVAGPMGAVCVLSALVAGSMGAVCVLAALVAGAHGGRLCVISPGGWGPWGPFVC